MASSVSWVVAPPAINAAVIDASPSLPFGSDAEPLFTQMLNAMNGEPASGSAMIPGASAARVPGVTRSSASMARAIRVCARMSALLHHGDRRAAGIHEVLPRRFAEILRRQQLERLHVILERFQPPG